MNINQQALSLAISVTSLLYSNVFTTVLVAKADAPKPLALVQMIAQKSTSPIEGIWQVQDKYRIQISQDNGIYNGKIVWVAPNSETKDVKNSDRNLRSRELMGVEMLKGFTYNANKKQWTGGSLYIPSAGKTIKAKLWMSGEKELKVQISMGLFTKTMKLTAVQ
jgi:uncharacterized protein (DUF2147 family)